MNRTIEVPSRCRLLHGSAGRKGMSDPVDEVSPGISSRTSTSRMKSTPTSPRIITNTRTVRRLISAPRRTSSGWMRSARCGLPVAARRGGGFSGF
ncbi:unnamed protein product [Phytomonas sp. EM1]|nr:unnamed protein product [Phytomonas sp. EM1]|eukprot:CCW65215.1 unnamed protein product [Phytomonas sp. isolate EM1]